MVVPWRAVAYSAGGDGGRRSPELSGCQNSAMASREFIVVAERGRGATLRRLGPSPRR